MTTDTAALQERIEAALIRATDDGADRTEEYAAAVLPIIAAEVQAAKAETLREAVEKYAITIPDALGYKVPAVTVEDLMDAADEHEAGDQA